MKTGAGRTGCIYLALYVSTLLPRDSPWKSSDPAREEESILSVLPGASVYILMGIRTYLNSIGSRQTLQPGFRLFRTGNESRAHRGAARARGLNSRGAKQE